MTWKRIKDPLVNASIYGYVWHASPMWCSSAVECHQIKLIVLSGFIVQVLRLCTYELLR